MQLDSNIQAMEVCLSCHSDSSSGSAMQDGPDDCIGGFCMQILRKGLLSAYARMACNLKVSDRALVGHLEEVCLSQAPL